MLNIYFVFGVPAFLLILYLIFAYIRKKTTIRYLGFILLIIASFMLVDMEQASSRSLSDQLGYPVYLIWIPITVAGFLVLLNLFRAWRRLKQLRKKTG